MYCDVLYLHKNSSTHEGHFCTTSFFCSHIVRRYCSQKSRHFFSLVPHKDRRIGCQKKKTKTLICQVVSNTRSGYVSLLSIYVTLIANPVLISEETDKSFFFFKSNEINYNQKIQTESEDCRYFTRLPLASLSLEKQCLFVNEQTRLPLCRWKYSYSS